MLNERAFQETGMVNISRLILKRQLLMFSHVAELSKGDPVHRILAYADPQGRMRKRGHQLHMWLRQIAEYFMRVQAMHKILIKKLYANKPEK